MTKSSETQPTDLLDKLIQENYLFRDLERDWLAHYLPVETLKLEKLFSNRPIYTAFLPDQYLDVLYVILGEGLVITRSTPLDRILAHQAFPCLVEAYKTTHVLKIPKENLIQLYDQSEIFREHYRMLFELRQKFEYHLLNCSSYPPQAVAALLRALIYQERELSQQPDSQGHYVLDLPIDVIARACQLNQRTVEQVMKGMQQIGLVTSQKEDGDDIIRVIAPEGLKEVYSATREKVSWWPLR